MSDLFDETDDVIARKFAETPVPADLRARILASVQPAAAPAPVVEASRAPHWWSNGVTAIAACLSLALLSLGSILHSPTGGSLAQARRDLGTFLSGNFDLQVVGPTIPEVKRWFAKQHGGAAMDLPSALAAYSPEGCRQIEWQGHQGTLVCFALEDGQVAHLVTFPSGTFAQPPGNRMQLAQSGEWTEGMWSRDGMTYILFAPGGEAGLRRLIAYDSPKTASSSALSSVRARAKSSGPRLSSSSGVCTKRSI